MPRRDQLIRAAEHQAKVLAGLAAKQAAKRASSYWEQRNRPYKMYDYPIGPSQKGRYKHQTKRYKKPAKSLKKQVKELRHDVNADIATHTYKKQTVGFDTCLANQTSYQELLGWHPSTLENAIANLRYYNPAVPGTLTTADGGTGTYSRKFHFASLYTCLEVNNPSKVPIEVDVYLCSPKADTAQEPSVTIDQGLADQGNPTNTSTLLYPTDSDQFGALWSVKMHKKMTLNSGRTRKFTHSAKDITYDPAEIDVHTLKYQRKVKSVVWLVRIQGVLSTDNTLTNQEIGSGIAYCACRQLTKFVIKYDAGTKLNDITIADGNETFTNYPAVPSDDKSRYPGNQ